jgi:hypothetical protein
MSTLRARYSAVHERGKEAGAGRLLTMHVRSRMQWQDSRCAGTACNAGCRSPRPPIAVHACFSAGSDRPEPIEASGLQDELK